MINPHPSKRKSSALLGEITASLNRIDWTTDADRLEAVLNHIKARADRWKQAAAENPCPTLENRADAEQHFYEECRLIAHWEED